MLSTGAIDFDESRNEYRHCCCHIRIASIVIACFCIIGSIMLLLTVVITYSNGGSMLGLGTFIVILILSLACIVVMSLLVNGVERNSSKLIVPAVIYLGLGELSLVAAVIFTISTMTTVGKGSDRKLSLGVLGGLLLLTFICIAVSGYYIWLFRKLHKYLKDKENSTKLLPQPTPLDYPQS